MLTSDREDTIAKAIHPCHQEKVLHSGPRPHVGRKNKEIFVEEDFEIHGTFAVCPNGMWKGLAMARVPVGLAIAMINTLKQYKIIRNGLESMTLRPAA